MRRVRITLGYDGTEFFGSQSQVGRRTVQREFEAVLQRIAPGSSGTVFAGRTDRGVHAVGRVVSFDTTWRRTDDGLLDALNAVAPSDLSIVEVRTVDDTSSMIRLARSLGVQVYVVKEDAADELVPAVQAALEGREYVSATARRNLR